MLAKLQFIVSTFKWSRTHDPDGHSAQQEKEINIQSLDFFLDVLSSHDSFQIQMLSNLEQSNRQWDVWQEAEKARQKSSTGSCKIDFIFLSFNENCKLRKCCQIKVLSTKSQFCLFEIMRYKSIQIRQKYTNKQENLNRFRWSFSFRMPDTFKTDVMLLSLSLQCFIMRKAIKKTQ